MYCDRKIAVIIPALNEEKLISKVISSMPAFIDYMIVVDDSSCDNTADVVAGLKKENVILMRHTRNQGVGSAIVSGYKKALEIGTDIMVVMAADAQMDPADLPLLLEPLLEGKADYTKGNRFKSLAVLKKMPKIRLIGNIALSLLTKIVSGYWGVFDSQCGYTAITREALLALELDRLYKRYGFPNHMLVSLNAHNLKVLDVSVKAIYTDEKSKLKVAPFIPRIAFLFTGWFLWRLFYKYELVK